MFYPDQLLFIPPYFLWISLSKCCYNNKNSMIQAFFMRMSHASFGVQQITSGRIEKAEASTGLTQEALPRVLGASLGCSSCNSDVELRQQPQNGSSWPGIIFDQHTLPVCALVCFLFHRKKPWQKGGAAHARATCPCRVENI